MPQLEQRINPTLFSQTLDSCLGEKIFQALEFKKKQGF